MDEKMSFGENLQCLRKQRDITQEQLAEQLEVSRQSVSKWESGASYPEMEKLLQICSLFNCNMDTLMQGDVSKSFAEDVHGYDKFQNWFSKMITGGTAILLFGISVMMFLNGLGFNEVFAVAAFFGLLIVAVMMFIVAGLQYDQFQQKHPLVEDFYSEEEKDLSYRKFTVRIAAGVGMILIDVLYLIVANGILEGQVGLDAVLVERCESLMMGAFMLILTAAVAILVYGGMQKSKTDVKEYNKEKNKTPEQKKRAELNGKICGCIMLLATIIFLVWGLMFDGFKIAWIAYAVGGILCGIASVILSKESE